jgi:hypothetical protein
MSDRRTLAAGTAMLLLVPILAAGCGSRQNVTGAADPENSPVETVTMDPLTGITPLECGQSFRPPAPGQLTLSGQFPDAALASDELVTGTVDVVSATELHGVGAQRADVFLVREGRVVTLPVAQDSVGVQWDLAAGAAQTLPGAVALVACGPTGGPVGAGRYDLYARVAVTPTEGSTVESFGGPWPLEVQ